MTEKAKHRAKNSANNWSSLNGKALDWFVLVVTVGSLTSSNCTTLDCILIPKRTYDSTSGFSTKPNREQPFTDRKGLQDSKSRKIINFSFTTRKPKFQKFAISDHKKQNGFEFYHMDWVFDWLTILILQTKKPFLATENVADLEADHKVPRINFEQIR